ncbi:Glutathione transport system permease protein GsiC [Geodia barretti]|uniref:Glutathione transport system permease protein GsiC n=1 Tax=Geodia barretti TaxID=519541 RepID=A0AA35RRX5_GEOBA|nr:Glutathione transport system permease protein GsiC [Geodia barretti]
MRNYLYQRLLLAIPTLFGVTALIFIAMRVLPGDPLLAIYGESSGLHILTEEELKGARESLGLDKPLYLQYASWIGDVLKGDFGRSFWQDRPIRDTILRRGPITAEIAVIAVALSWIIGLPVGLIAAAWRNTWIDYVVRVVVTFFMAVPSFWLGLTLILATVLIWQWRPPLTIIHLWDDPWGNLTIVIGPAVVMAINMGAELARMSRATLWKSSAKTMCAPQGPKGWLNACIQLAFLLGGSVAVERAFAVPGLGTTLVNGIAERDWMIIQNVVLLYGISFVIINLGIDLLYGLLDPRIRYQ